MKGFSPRFLLYAAVVVVAGAVSAAIGFAHPILPPSDLDTVAVLAGLLVITEMAPVTFLHRRHEMQVSTSTAFTLGILLVGGVGQALAAQMLALFFTEVKDRKHPVKVVFNVAQYAVSVVSAWGVQVGLGGAHPLVHGVLPLRDAPVLAATAVTFLVVNNGLVWIAQSVNGGPPVSAIVADEWYFHAVTGVVLAGLAPVIALVAVQAIGLLPLLLIPVGAVYLSARSTLRQAHQARHDGLTGLPNRSRFLAAAEDALAEPGRSRDPLALLLIDLDRFKEINDTLGHHTGDLLLRQIGPRIQAAHRDISLVARLGGDEFAVLVAHAGGPDHAVDIARAITAALGRPIVLDDGLVLEVEASVGVVVTPEHGRDVETLIRRADVAMYLAKTARAGVELYAPDRDINTLRRLSLVGQLRAAIETGALTLHYQPKLDVARGEYTGVEALARWTDPELGPVTPDEFIPVAEQSGLIRPLTELVLRRAIGQAREWHDRGMALRVAVNLSARSFLDLELPATVSTLLAEVGLDPAFLELEITETELMSDPPRGARVLSRLHAMGVRLTIDDFGTGHSSLAYLRSLPVHEIKIDRCFVASMVGADRSTDDIIVRSTIELARNLGLEVTAEGVETAEQLATLTDLGCDYLQGFLLSRPVPPRELETFLEASSAVAATRRRAGDRSGRPDLRRVVRSD